MEYSAEVLVTRSDLDEKRNRMAELEQQVAELTMQTEYQLRLKDLHLQEKTKELTGGLSFISISLCAPGVVQFNHIEQHID